MHEAQLHERNSFITLTYNDESLATRRPTWEPTVPYTLPQSPPSRNQMTKRAQTKRPRTQTH